MGRTVTLVLLDPAGTPLGELPPFPTGLPWWQEVSELVEHARTRYHTEVAVLRLLEADRPLPPGGAVRYLAQASGPVPVDLPVHPVPLDLGPRPERADYAEIGGPARSLAWATEALTGLAHPPILGVAQQRTWNLSAIWRLDTAAGPVWLKQVPRFFRHEATILAWLARRAAPTPRLLAADPFGRMLLADIPGDDWYAATPADRELIARDAHAIQRQAVVAVGELVSAGVPDWRGERLVERVRRLVARSDEVVPGLPALVEELPRRLAEVTTCGLPDTLVHGDLHPGNVRTDGVIRTVIDWGDAFVGHPGFDILRLVERVAEEDAARLTKVWATLWREAAPGCDPERAADLLRPVAALRNACVYAAFLDQIEPAEHPYHQADVGTWLRAAVTDREPLR